VVSSKYVKGKRAEYEIIMRLKKYGYAVIRAPASGAKAKKVFYPDVFAVKFDGNSYKVLVLEVKLRDSRETIYIAGPKMWMLMDYARRAGGKAYIAVKVSSEKRWFMFPVEMLQKQEFEKGVRYVITVDMYEKAMHLWEVV